MDGLDVSPIQVFTKTAVNGRWELKRIINKPSVASVWNHASIPLVETQNFAVSLIFNTFFKTFQILL